MKRKLRLPGFQLLQHLRAQDVRRHQVRGKLHPPLIQPHDLAQGFDQARLGEAGNPDQQGVAAGQQGYQALLDDVILSENDLANRLAGSPSV